MATGTLWSAGNMRYELVSWKFINGIIQLWQIHCALVTAYLMMADRITHTHFDSYPCYATELSTTKPPYVKACTSYV